MLLSSFSVQKQAYPSLLLITHSVIASWGIMIIMSSYDLEYAGKYNNTLFCCSPTHGTNRYTTKRNKRSITTILSCGIIQQYSCLCTIVSHKLPAQIPHPITLYACPRIPLKSPTIPHSKPEGRTYQ